MWDRVCLSLDLRKKKKKNPENLTATLRRQPTPTSSVSCSRNGVDQFTVWHAPVTASFIIPVSVYFWSQISSIRTGDGKAHGDQGAALSFASLRVYGDEISWFVILRPKSQCSLANRHLFVWFEFYFSLQAINALWFNWDLEDFLLVYFESQLFNFRANSLDQGSIQRSIIELEKYWLCGFPPVCPYFPK